MSKHIPPHLRRGLKAVICTVVLLLALPLLALAANAQDQGLFSGYTADAPMNREVPNPKGLHIFIWAGLKTHPPGRHDYPQFLADWSKILTEHGAVVDGALHPPSAEDLAHTDVLILYKGDAGYINDAEKKVLTDYVKRGGGFVSIHDSLCGPDPQWFADNLTGAAKKHGEINFTNPAPVSYTVVDKDSPIMEGMSDFTIYDEAFFKLTWSKLAQVHVLATALIVKTPWTGDYTGKVVPQIWTYERTLAGGQPARTFVWMQGDNYSNFDNYQLQRMLLRGIAWAGKQPVDSLVDYVPPARPPFRMRGPNGANPQGKQGGNPPESAPGQ